MRGAKEKAARCYNSVCQQQVEQNISIPEENKKSYFDLIPCINSSLKMELNHFSGSQELSCIKYKIISWI